MKQIHKQFIEVIPKDPFCHAATILEYEDKVFCAWFAGKYEGDRNSCIRVSQYIDSSWTESVSVAQGKEKDQFFPCWNPVLTYQDEIVLFYKVGVMPSRWRGYFITSSDGKSWSSPTLLPEGFYGPVKNKPIMGPDNQILCPSSEESGGWSVHLERTSNIHQDWQKTNPLNDSSLFLIQPTIFKFPSGKLQLLCRSSHDYVYALDSFDCGKTWSPPYKTELPNPNSGIDGIVLFDGRGVLVYNHSINCRFPLNIAVTNDEGKTWNTSDLQLESTPNNEGYSYPAVIQDREGNIHIVYSWRYSRIFHTILAL